jgi:type I restriction-modification system DNA methylase subunit
MVNIRKLEAELWESADLLRQGSKLTSSQYCMPVLALLFLRYAYSRYKMVEAEILQNRPMRGGRVMPVEPSDFAAKSALYLPREAQFDYLVNLPDNIIDAHLKTKDGQPINSLGEAVNNAMQLVEDQSEQLTGVLPKTYTILDRQKAEAKAAIAEAQRKDKKRIEAEQNALIAALEDTEKFGEGEYKDILGLCKVATTQEIEEKNYSLTPGAYVGVAEVEDDGVDFHERMNEIHTELAQLNAEANTLMDEILKEWEELK